MVYSSNGRSIRPSHRPARAGRRGSDSSRPTGAGRARRRAEARRLEILRAAARIFRERGYAQTGMRDIADAADLSPGNLYHYFKGKDEILFCCQDRSLDRMLRALSAARTATHSSVDRLHGLAIAHLHCLLDEFEGSAAHFEVDVLPPALRAQIVAKRDRYERGVRGLVAEGTRHGELTVADPSLATRGFLGALNWTAHWFRREGPQTSGQVAEQIATYAVSGLISKRGSRERPTHRS